MNADSLENRTRTASALMAVALVFGMCLAWSPAFWAVFAAQAGVLLVAIFWFASKNSIDISPELIVVALISCWGGTQIALGQTISSWWTIRASTTWISMGMSFFVASHVLRRRGNLDRFLSILLWGCTTLAAIAIVQIYSSPDRIFGIFHAEPGAVGTFLYKNQFAAMLELAAPIALYRALCCRGKRYPAVAAYTVLFAAGVASVSRAGVVLLLAELAATLIIGFYLNMLNRRKWMGILALVVIVITAACAIGGPVVLWDHFHQDEPYGVRYELLKATSHMAADRPWGGFGLGTFHVAYPAYARFDIGVLVNAAHSDWAEWAAEGGLPFPVFIASLLLLVSARAVRSVWGIGVLAVAFHSIIDYPAREPTVALTWFALAGALAATRVRSRAADRPFPRTTGAEWCSYARQ